MQNRYRRLLLAVIAALICAVRPAPAQFTQQGPKLVGTGFAGTEPDQGYSVALSADGNTAIVGGLSDNGSIGAAWVFTRSGGVWTQQGPKLVGSGAVGTAEEGASVTLSSDGNTAIVGGPADDFNNDLLAATGAAWVFTRSGGVWSQRGRSWSAAALLEAPGKAGRSRCPATATPPSWVDH